jgi:hypothetical protein
MDQKYLFWLASSLRDWVVRSHAPSAALGDVEQGPPGLDGGPVERKIFWTSFIVLSLIADISLPLLWGVLATIPIALLSWWVAYRSGWF